EEDAGASADAGADPDPPAPPRRILDHRWFGQPNGYWCGPASTRMALGTRMSRPPRERTLASFMHTTTNGTDHIGLPAAALNKWLSPTRKYRARPMDVRPTDAQRDLLR